jgi:hypothetical protein
MSIADRAVLVTEANSGNGVENEEEDILPRSPVTEHGRKLAQRGSQSVRAPAPGARRSRARPVMGNSAVAS